MKTRRVSLILRHSIPWLLVVCFGAVMLPASQAAPAAVQAHHGTLTLPTYPWWPVVPHPYFRETDDRNIYPYPMMDNLSREKTERSYQTVILENEYLRITFLPELGGKIYEVIDKTTGQPMFYVNHVVKPGLIGLCGAWTSGGVEWNTGPQGHTATAMQPVDVVMLAPAQDGSRSVAIGETERIYGTHWTVLVTLRPGRAFIEERIRIYNPTDRLRPYYFWNCTAMPNTPGFRFIYPMTLGCDHSAEKFFNWPVDHGKDMTRAANYYDASSIFAWHCDQDFFGSYDDGAERGVVSCANHYQVPGKKAWTWGQGGYGKMHQRDLTDTDGPYNEVQTGPLLTQGEVGRLEPCESVEWNEWWYPIHGLGGFTYANRDLAVNAAVQTGELRLRMLGTGTWRKAVVRVRDAQGGIAAQAECALSPRQPSRVSVSLPPGLDQPDVELVSDGKPLARFRVPLPLPLRTRPARKAAPDTAAELAQAGWEDYLFARFPEAEAHFHEALKKDPKSVSSHTGLAVLQLDRDPRAARQEAEAALDTDPDSGLARFTLACAWLGEDESAALDQAWQSSLDPTTAAAGRALAARIQIGRQQFRQAAAALSGEGPWQADSLCRDRLAFADLMLGENNLATELARKSLTNDPLDTFAASLLWLTKASGEAERLGELLSTNPPAVLELATDYLNLKQEKIALRLIQEFYLRRVPERARDPLVSYWAQFLSRRLVGKHEASAVLEAPRAEMTGGVFPSTAASALVLQDAVAHNPGDGQAALELGDVLFHLGRCAEGRAMWKKAAELGASPAIACRALGMASLTLDNDPESAAKYLAQAHRADPADAIVARDLAKVLLAAADRTEDKARKTELWTQARDVLQAAFLSGKSRSDFVCLLARSENLLQDYAATARMLESVRLTVWEGSHEAHDLFEQAHLGLGRAELKAGKPAQALVEFDRALEYPENLAIGKLENAREGHIQRLRAEALNALGQTDAARQAEEKADRERERRR
jgi:tetratricopeptide (TPR) repeat protein